MSEPLRRITTELFTSVDGVVDADSDWQFEYFDEQFFGWVGAGLDAADTVLLGRRTYEGFAALWGETPGESPMAVFLENAERYVVSTTIGEPSWAGTRVLGADLHAEVSALKARPGRDIIVVGSPTLVRWLLHHRLLDELRVSVLPAVVGWGTRLWPDMPRDLVRLEVASVEVLPSGVQQIAYRPVAGTQS